MRRLLCPIIALILLSALPYDALAQRRSSASRSYNKSQKIYTPKYNNYAAPKKQTYDVGGTKYKMGESYKSTGLPKVERSSSAKKEFLKSQGYKKTPSGYEVDHIVPLSKGGADKPYNMQLLPKEVHKQKTANERKKKY
ncbi:MAG TPA: HNH endonuclease signature motif containing protein [Nitrososphaera sp.]|nr:HNH endonuclease signature motif containing protein [Nitrososphaera sp.]